MEEVKISVEGTTAELVIRHGDAPKVYDPVPLVIDGVIDSVSRWLQNRLELLSHFGALERSHILVDFEKGEIELVVDETEHFSTFVKGTLQVHPNIQKFGINSGEFIIPEKMANHLKARKHLFESQSEYAAVYSALRAFKAKVNQEIDAIKDDRGNYELKKSQAVEHNIPGGFLLKVPLFKATNPVSIPVEFLVSPTLDVALSSTELIQLSDEMREQVIREEVARIEEITKAIVIIYV